MEPVLKENNTLIDKTHALDLLYRMLLIRRFEEKSAEMYSLSKIRGFLHLYSGEEAVAVGVNSALGPEDNILSTYREHGQALARGINPSTLMAEMFGKVEGSCKGRGGSMHIFDTEKKFYGGNAIVAGHLAMAVGMGLASKKQKTNHITCCFFGDGAVAEGEFHEAMNLAALWQVPVLFVCENNLYAMGTALRFSHAVTKLESRGAAYGINSASVDGMDVEAVEKAAKQAVDYIATNSKPFFLVCETYRFRAHSMFDAELYRDKKEVEEWKKRDPIVLFRSKLESGHMIDGEEWKRMESKVDDEIKKAVDFAEAGKFESIGDIEKHLY